MPKGIGYGRQKQQRSSSERMPNGATIKTMATVKRSPQVKMKEMMPPNDSIKRNHMKLNQEFRAHKKGGRKPGASVA